MQSSFMLARSSCSDASPGGLALCALLLEHAPTPRRSPVL